MDSENAIKLVTAGVAIVGAFLGFLHFLTTRRSAGYQNSKIEMELLSECIAANEGEPAYKQFLLDVRKERISFLVFGIVIPNADVERVVAYYKKADGKVTTREISRAWQYRDSRKNNLSFRLHGSDKAQYIFVLAFATFCLLSAAWGAIALASRFYVNALVLVGVSLTACIFVLLINQNLFTATRLGSLEEHNPRARIRH